MKTHSKPGQDDELAEPYIRRKAMRHFESRRELSVALGKLEVLTADLAASQARVKELEDWRTIHIGEVASLSGDVDREKALREEAEERAEEARAKAINDAAQAVEKLWRGDNNARELGKIIRARATTGSPGEEKKDE